MTRPAARRLRPMRTLALLVLSPLLGLSGPTEAAEPAAETTCLFTGGSDVGAHRGTLFHGPAVDDEEAFVGGTFSDTHRYWLRFDLSGLPADVDEITSAVLTLTAGRKSFLSIGVALAEDDWSPSTLTWDTQPAFDLPVAVETYAFLGGEQYTWDVTSHVAGEHDAGDALVSLVLMQVPEGQRTGNVWFHRDAFAPSDVERPSLCVTYTRRADTPPVVTPAECLALWPPDHAWHGLTLADLASAQDAEDGTLDLATAGEILSVRSDEAADARGGGDGHTAQDIVIDGPGSLWLRAERAGNGNGRVYVVTFAVRDSGGNEAVSEATVQVPRDATGPAVDDGAGAGHVVTR